MYSVSEEYKKALLQTHITDTVEGNIILKDGTVIELNDRSIVTGSLRISHELCEDYRIGTFNLGSMHLGFFDDSALLRDFSGARITLDYKLETENGWESVPLGIFIADGQSVVRRRNTVTLTAYDYGVLFDCTIGTSIRNMSGTAEMIISAVCERCGVVFGGIAEGLPNTSVYVSPSSERIQSCRDLVGWCAALLCGYAVIDREGKLKIISARYSVEEDDPTEIIIDKYVTSTERDSIYSTDTRGWIAQMSAYSNGKVKIYKSNMTHDDSQAARAVYYLENNPLTENMSESYCDEINCDWLKFIDGFMQRGITAKLYGDPALDAGDILRCSEGDIDQRRSIVGLVTKQEWRYRDYHTVICASPQLSDGFEENTEEQSSSETEAVGETDSIYPVKVVSQTEKRSEKGKTYMAGNGIFFSGDKENRINLHPAGSGTAGYGGVTVTNKYWSEWTPFTDSEEEPDMYRASYGLYMYSNNHYLRLRTATAKQKGGFYLGDGFTPLFNTETDEEGNVKYNYTSKVELRLGDGLEFIDNAYPSDETEAFRNRVSGRRVAVTPATEKTLGGIKVGEGLKIESDGTLSAESGAAYEQGDGIVIDEGEEKKKISVSIDNDTITLEDGKLKAKGLTIENAVIIQEADIKNLLHEYTEIEYTQGSKVLYAGPQNQIICNGYIFGHTDVLANLHESIRYDSVPIYQSMTFNELSATGINAAKNYTFSARIVKSFIDSWQVEYQRGDYVYPQEILTYDTAKTGWVPTWNAIYAPTEAAPFGFIQARMKLVVWDKANNCYGDGLYFDCGVTFASEAEYNAATGLTYEPVTLTEVQETVTEV